MKIYVGVAGMNIRVGKYEWKLNFSFIQTEKAKGGCTQVWFKSSFAGKLFVWILILKSGWNARFGKAFSAFLSKNAFHFRWKNAEVTFSRLCEAWGASNDPSAEGPPQYPCWTRLRHWRWIKTLWYMHNTDLDPNSLQTCKGYLVQDVLQPDKKKQTVVVDLYGCPLSCTLACTRMHRIRLSSSSLWPL